MRNSVVLACGVLAVLSGSVARADDWPQWRGVQRTGLSAEKGLVARWPEGGPKLLWSARSLGEGHAAPSVAAGKIFGMGLVDEGELVWAIEEKTGKPLWSTRIAPGVTLGGGQGGYGSRATPTIVGDRLYALGVGGVLVCLKVADGALVWKKNLVTDFGGEVPTWGYCESPLVDGNTVVAAPGGRNTVVAFNRNDGSVLWQCAVPGSDGAHYSSAILAEVGGRKEYIHFLAGGVVGIDARTGKFLWRYRSPANGTANCSTPIFRDGLVFAASGYGTGGGAARLTPQGEGVGAEEVYFTRNMKNHHGGVVLVGDYLYGFDESNLTCLEFKTGKLMWSNRSVGKGSVSFADGNLICRSERGTVGLVEATPTAYVEKGRFEQPERSREPSWAYPVIANGRLYLRDQGTLLCYDLKGAN